MIPAPGAGSEGTKKKRKRKRSGNRGPQPQTQTAPNKSPQTKRPYAKRVDEVSAGGLVIDTTGTKGFIDRSLRHQRCNQKTYFVVAA
jgi:hypothetical protein